MMGRAWFLAAAVIVGLSSVADAKRAEPCQCVETRSYPELDSNNVPTNQKAIEIRPWDEAEPFKITSLGDLEPDTDYHFDNAPFLRFHTANGPDVHVPSKPVSINPTIVIRKPFGADRYDSQTAIALWGDYGDDARFLEVFIEGKDGKKAHFGMGTWNPHLCGQPLHLSAGPATITVWAIDQAGQRSAEPWTGEVTISEVDYDPTGGECELRHRHFKCGTGMLALLFVGAIFYGFILLVLFIISLVRRSRIRNWPGEHVSIPLAESVARITARAYMVKLVVATLGISALWQLDYNITAVMLSPLTIVWLLDVIRAHLVVHRFAHPVNRLERREDWLLVDHTLLHCGRWAWSRASRLPPASVTKR